MDPNSIPASIAKFMAADRAGKLSSKDRNAVTVMRNGVMMTPEETAADMLENVSEPNMMGLAAAIDKASTPEQKQILLEERDRIQGLSDQMQTMGVLGKIQAQVKSQTQPVNPPSIMDQIGTMISNLWSSQ